MTKEILNITDIKILVDTFYAKVRRDELLAPVFEAVIQERWAIHLEKMYRFWQTVLLGEHTYHGSPFTPHGRLPVDGSHFDRWIKLFHEAIDENFTGEKCIEAKWRAGKMAEMFQYKIAWLRDNPKAIQ